MRRHLVIAAVCAVACAGALLIAGPLTPSAGPVASTYKTLAEIEPRIAINAANTPGDATSMYKITAPGSYYLTGQVAAVPGKHAIVIASDAVTLDLAGYRVAGYPGSLDGLHADGTRVGITVHSGVVGPVGAYGVNLISATGSRVHDVTVSDSQLHGMTIGAGSVIRACSVTGAGQTGINVNSGCTVVGCTVSDAAGVGIYANGGTLVEGCSVSSGGSGIALDGGAQAVNCTAVNTASQGFTGIGDCRIASCSAAGNRTHGILLYSGGLVLGNTCTDNGQGAPGAGIRLSGNNARVEGNTCIGNTQGIQTIAGGNIIVRNTCTSNTTNWDISGGNRCLVVNAASAGSFSGNSGGAGLGSTDPNANFTY